VEGALEYSLKELDTPYVFARGNERFPRDFEGRMMLGKTTYVDTSKAMEKLL
jgi:alcohol dehydrogenase (NADP+)